MYQKITRLAAVAAASATILLTSGTAQASTMAPARTVSGTEYLSGVTFGTNQLTGHASYPLVLQGLVKTYGVLRTTKTYPEAVLRTPLGRLGVELTGRLTSYVISVDPAICYVVQHFMSGLRTVPGRSTGIFTRAKGAGTLAATTGAFMPREKSGGCATSGNPRSAINAFIALSGKLALTLCGPGRPPMAVARARRG